jgi:hypothetical protein
MKLEISNASEVINPSAAQIADALSNLPGGDESFAILTIDPQTYVQVAGSPADGFTLEYRDGSEEKHFVAIGAPIDLKLVTSVFQKYAAGDASWQSLVSWQPWTAGSLGSTSFSRIILFIVGVMVLAGGLYLAFAT